jgi:hypothetical protein
MPDKTVTPLTWGNDTITIKGRNAGIKHLTVFFDDEQLNIIDFLNHSLMAEYASLYETIMSTYEAKLKSGSIFDHDFPETTFTAQDLDPSHYQANTPDDKALIEALLRDYNSYLELIKNQFKQYKTLVEQWYYNLSQNTKNSSSACP